MAFVRLCHLTVLLVTGVLSLPALQQILSTSDGGLHMIEPFTGWQPPFDGSRDVTFYLYTQDNPVTPQIITLDDDFSSPSFNPSNPTRFVIHGWTFKAEDLDEYREAYIATGNEYNVVLVDWSGPASVEKPEVANSSVVVGDYIGQVINHLIESRGLDPDDLHLIGHSMGAHVAGIAGKRVGGQISEIVALDPANHAYVGADYEEQLEKSDAKFIQVIYTNGGSLGLLESQGHVDFFPNGGIEQVGCVIEDINGCSHLRALDYYMESINSNNFIATQCSSYEEYKQGACSANEHVAMGEYSPLTSSGTYFLDTNGQSPYAQGQTDL